MQCAQTAHSAASSAKAAADAAIAQRTTDLAAAPQLKALFTRRTGVPSSHTVPSDMKAAIAASLDTTTTNSSSSSSSNTGSASSNVHTLQGLNNSSSSSSSGASSAGGQYTAPLAVAAALAVRQSPLLPGLYHLVPRCWLSAWRAWLKDAKAPAPVVSSTVRRQMVVQLTSEACVPTRATTTMHTASYM
jgi:hypothetical protein